MFIFILILLLLLILLLWLLWPARGWKPETPTEYAGHGTVVRIPNFEPMPRRPTDIRQPESRDVVVSVRRDGQGVPVDLSIEPLNLVLNPAQQAAWSAGPSRGNEGGKLEIRFSPNSAPFGGAAFTTARGGVAMSGAPARSSVARGAQNYTILLTTPDGYLLRKSASVTVTGGQVEQAAEQYQFAAAADEADELASKGTLVKLPDFKPIPLGKSSLVEPPSKEVNVRVIRNENGAPVDIAVVPDNLVLTPDEQAAWTTGPRRGNEGGKIEIRFSPNATPFGGAAFVTARGGIAKSGRPVESNVTRNYLILLITPDGVRLEKEASVTVLS